jgi:hypothetical protein
VEHQRRRIVRGDGDGEERVLRSITEAGTRDPESGRRPLVGGGICSEVERIENRVFARSGCAAAFGDTLVVPGLQTNAPGNVAIPVGSKANRFQEVIGSGQFPGPVVITGMRVRSAPGTGPVGFNDPSYKITLSTTQAYPNTVNGHTLPSVTYANNVGPDATTVYNAAASGSFPGCAGAGSVLSI